MHYREFAAQGGIEDGIGRVVLNVRMTDKESVFSDSFTQSLREDEPIVN